jgi:predicted permease
MRVQRPHRPFWYLRRAAPAITAEVDEELRVHLEMRVEALMSDGWSREEARQKALRQFGDLQATRDYCARQDADKERSMSRGLTVDEAVQDLRVSLRGLLRAPLTAAAIVLTVGIGIGATAAIYGVIDTTLVRPLPYPDAASLVRIYTDSPPNRFPFSVADYQALAAQQTTFAQVAGYTDGAMTFSDGRIAERVRSRTVTPTYFDLLAIRPAAGRAFSAQDGRPGSPGTVVLSHRFWQQRLGGRADAIGASVKLDGADYTVTGVLPPQPGPLEIRPEIFVAAQWNTPPRKGPFFITALARLRPGVDRGVAAAELRAINRRLFPLWRSSYQDQRATWGMLDLKEQLVGRSRSIVALALGAVALVWLIACVNASNLLIARVTSRRRELAVRSALGASRARVVRFLLAESAWLALFATGIGVAVAAAALALVRAFAADYVPRTAELTLDGRVFGVLALLTLFSVLLFGLVPALHGTGGPVDEGLRAMGRASTGSRAVRQLRRVLVGAQFAIATPLLVVAGLLLGSLTRLQSVDLGFDTHNLLTGALLLPPGPYRDADRVESFWQELERRVRELPGVRAVAFTDSRPPDDAQDQNNFELEAAPTPPGGSQPVTTWVSATPEYFGLMGIALGEGRLLRDTDGGSNGPSVVVVDRAWARRFFPGQSAVGQRLRGGGCTDCPWTTVVGVVSDVKYDGLGNPNQGIVYWPMTDRGVTAFEAISSRFRFLVVRTDTDALAAAPAVRKVIRDMDDRLAFSSVATIDEMVERSLEVPRSLSVLVGGLAAAALLLSLVGIYGVMAYYVQQRARDISIRLALGGTPAGVRRLVVGDGLALAAGGVAAGLALAYVLARYVATLLYETGTADPLIYSAVAALTLVVAAAACLLPARRATMVEPAAVLRGD